MLAVCRLQPTVSGTRCQSAPLAVFNKNAGTKFDLKAASADALDAVRTNGPCLSADL